MEEEHDGGRREAGREGGYHRSPLAWEPDELCEGLEEVVMVVVEAICLVLALF